MAASSVQVQTGVFDSNAVLPETTAMRLAIIAAGSTVDSMTLGAVDEFITAGKRDGWWDLILDCSLFVGKDLPGALVKLKAATGTPQSLSNTNIVAADYSQPLGVGFSSNTNKKLGTGLIPSALGLDTAGMSFGLMQLEAAYSSIGGTALLGMNNGGGGDSPILINQGVQVNNFVAAGGANAGGRVFQAMSFTPASLGIWSFDGIRGTQSTGGNVGAVVLTSQVSLFSCWRLGADRFSHGRLGFYFIGNPMTQLQLNALGVAVRAFNDRVGRSPSGVRSQFFGDSITSGQGGTVGDGSHLGTWTALTAQAVGLQELNLGAPSSQVSVSDATANSGLSRYVEAIAQGGANAFVMYGTNDMGADGVANGTSALVTTYQTNLATILTAYKTAGMKTVCVGMPVRTAANAIKTALWNAGNAAAARSAGVPFVDIVAAMNDTGTSATFLNADGVHPSDAGHALIAKRAVEATLGRLVRFTPLTFGAVAANSSVDVTLAMLGVDVGSGTAGTKQTEMTVTPYTGVVAGLSFSAFVSANDTVIVRCTNSTIGAITPTAAAYYNVTAYL